MKTERMFTVVVALQVLVLASVWTGPQLPAARALVLPDPGEQREKQLEELRYLNDKMDKLLDLLSGGNLQIKMKMPEDK